MSHESVDKAHRVAVAIKGHNSIKKHVSAYQPLEQTRSDMSAGARARLMGSLAAIIGGYKKN